MRYGHPSVPEALNRLQAAGARRILVLPAYPQYSGATTGSAFDAVAAWGRHARWVPELRFIGAYHDDPTYIAALADSIRKHGVLEPIIVRPKGGTFEIVAGERRFQAAMLAGLDQIPVTVRELDDRAALEIALSENLEREDLSPIEVALSFKDYLDRFSTTQEELAERLGKDRSTVANLIRLLDLPQPIRDAVDQKVITAGHARALLPLKDTQQLAAVFSQVMARQLSVRQTEALVRKILSRKPRPATPDEALRNIQETMQKLLATRVNIRGRVNRGVIEISYFNQEDLLRILGILNAQNQQEPPEAGSD